MSGVVWDSGSLSQQVLGQVSGDGVRLLAGQVTGLDPSLGVVCNVGGVTVTGVIPGNETVQVGDSVLILAQSGAYYVAEIIAASNRPILGTVSAVPAGSASITVTPSDGSATLTCGWVAAYSPAVSDQVWLAWLGSSPVVLGKVGNTAPLPPPTPVTPPQPPPQSTGTQTGTTTFTASQSGTYRSGWQDGSITNGNVMQGDYGYGMNSGAWFYGGRPASTLTGATVTSAQIWLARTYGGTYAAQTVHLARVAQNTLPSGAPTFDPSHTYDGLSLAVGDSGWYTLPTSLAQVLVDSGGSIGVQGLNPYVRLYGIPNSGQAGALRINWTKTS